MVSGRKYQKKDRKMSEQVAAGLKALDTGFKGGTAFPCQLPCPIPLTGGNRITQEVLGAHDGGVFGLCALRDGTLVSGGGRDRRVVLWGSDYSKVQEVEVRKWVMGDDFVGSCKVSIRPRFLTTHAMPPHLTCILYAHPPNSGPGGLWPCTHYSRGPGRHTVRGDHP